MNLKVISIVAFFCCTLVLSQNIGQVFDQVGRWLMRGTTITQERLLFTAVIAGNYPIYLSLFDNCISSPTQQHITAKGCIPQVLSLIGLWNIELAVWRKMTSWYHEDAVQKQETKMISFGGMDAYLLDEINRHNTLQTIKAEHQSGYADKAKRDYVKDLNIVYKPIFADDIAQGRVDIIGLAIHQHSKPSPRAVVLEAHHNGTWVLLSLVQTTENNNQGTGSENTLPASYWYTKEDRSVFMDCQYEAGIGETWTDRVASYAYGLWENSAQGNVSQEDLDVDRLLKCTTQVRTHMSNDNS